MGSTGGGIWKTTTAGARWQNVSDGFFATASIGAIDVADSDPNIIYVGTGSDAIRSNVIAGRGIYRSADAGKTWSFLGLREIGQVGAVIVHPTDPNTVLVAAIGHAFGPSPDRGGLSDDQWRSFLDQDALPVGFDRRRRSRIRSRQPPRGVRHHVAGPAKAVDHHQRGL
jgi:photosystem II stability/assembly factor-like uncharacterized protein